MKRFILSVGERIINIVVVTGMIISLLYAYSLSTLFGSKWFIAFLLFAIFGIMVVILGAFLIYLLIDIRDQLKALNEKTG